MAKTNVTQSKSKTQWQEVCTLSSIVLLLNIMGLNMVFIYPNSPHSQGGMKFATQISPLLNFYFILNVVYSQIMERMTCHMVKTL